MASSNELVITFRGDTSDALSKTNGLKGALGGLGDLAGGALKIGLLGAVGGMAALAGGLAASVGAAMEAETGQAALAAVLESTGGKAGVTADMANELASSLQNVTRFEDDTILAGENMLLTFTNIGKDVFPAATETMLNMAQAMGGDVKGAAIQLGKALNDPTQGMTALTRVGVTFTDEQKEMIKQLQESGDLMGAQKIILNELATEFGGAAVAAGDTFAGKLDILNHKFGDIMEAIGGALIPVLTTAADAIIGVLGNPAIQAAVQGLGTWIAGAVATIGGELNGLLGVIGPVFEKITTLFTSISESFAEGGIEDAFTSLVGGILKMFGVVGGEASSIAHDIKNGLLDALRGVMAFASTLQTAFQGLVEWIVGEFVPAFSAAFITVVQAALPVLQTFAGWITGTFLPGLQNLAGIVGPILGEAFASFGEFILNTVLPALRDIYVWILSNGIPAFGEFANKVGEVIAAIGPMIQSLIPTIQSMVSGLMTSFQGLIDWMVGDFAPALTESFSEISAAAGPVLETLMLTLQTFGEWILGTLLPAIQQLANWLGPILGAAFQNLGTFIVEQALPALTALAVWILKEGLPALGGLANQVGGALNEAFRIAKGLWEGLVKAFKDSVKFIDDTKTKLEEISGTIMTTVKDAFEFLRDNIIRPAVEALAGLKLKIEEVIAMVRNLIDAISKIPGGAADFLGGIIPDIPGIGGVPISGGGGGGVHGGGQIVGERFGGGGPGRGGVTINLTYAPVVSLMDEAEAQTRLTPFVREAVRAAMGS